MQRNYNPRFLALPIVLALAAAPVALAAPNSAPIPFTVSQPSAVPGADLAPGSYNLVVVNRLSDRVVLQVQGDNGQVNTTFLGVVQPAYRNDATGPLAWEQAADGKTYLRGYKFAGSQQPVEFVYPKADAVKLATANRASIPAVDPASEGKPADNTISRVDMEKLNLWLLHLDRVGSEGGGIQAQHYAASTTPKPKPAVAALPHTASLLPVVWTGGAICLLAAASMRVTRRKRHVAARSL